MAVYNGEDYLNESIKSILNQTHKDFEFIIVNDGSTDRTKSILDQLNDKRIKVIHLKQNQGVSNARNIAVQHAKADWIAVQDDDDFSYPNRLEEQAKFIKNHPDVIAVCTFIKSIRGNDAVTDQQLIDAQDYVNSTVTNEQILLKRFKDCIICCGTALFSKKAFQKVGGYPKGVAIGEDYELFLFKLLELGRIEVLPKILYQYRIDPKSVTQDDKIKTCNQLNLVSLLGIKKLVYNGFTFAPRVAILGSNQGCANFQQNIEPFIDFEVKMYYYLNSSSQLMHANNLFLRKKLDGIIVLENYNYESTLKFFINHGMEYNKNLFSIANLIS